MTRIFAMRSGVTAAVFLAALLAFGGEVGAQTTDLLLVLAADVSRSMDRAKFELQRQGYAAAIASSQVLEAIRSGAHRRIAVCYVEWSGFNAQKLVIDWIAIGDEASAREFADRVLEAPRSFADRTSISGGIEFAVGLLEHAPFEAPRRTIDVSGDGTNNSGREVTAVRDETIAKGITINGLVILSERPMSFNPEHTNPPGGLDNYYRENVVGGPGAFVMVAQDFNSFGRAILSKLIAEVALLPHSPIARMGQSEAQRNPGFR
jgi:Protein of unknown function (DUF1194)